MHVSRSKISSTKSRPNIYIYIYDVKFLALLGAPYIYDISRLRVNDIMRIVEVETYAVERVGQHCVLNP